MDRDVPRPGPWRVLDTYLCPHSGEMVITIARVRYEWDISLYSFRTAVRTLNWRKDKAIERLIRDPYWIGKSSQKKIRHLQRQREVFRSLKKYRQLQEESRR